MELVHGLRDADADAELHVRVAMLRGFPPFPTWNGTVAAPGCGPRALCSVLSASGDLVLLRGTADDSNAGDADAVRVVKVVPPACTPFSSFCQCWSTDGALLATAHDRHIAIYDSNALHTRAKLQLRYSVTSMDLAVRQPPSSSTDSDVEYLLLVGTAFGSFLFKVPLPKQECSSVCAGATPETNAEPVAHAHHDVAICFVKFSSDGRTAALAFVDGRVFLRRLDTHDDDTLATIGVVDLSRVLAAPRITGLSFSPCSTRLLVATRKGNVYVFARPASGSWQSVSSCEHLSANPKPKVSGVAGVSSAATTAQTLVCWWGDSDVFVICSRAVASRLELYDLASGKLLHSLQLAVRTATSQDATLSQWADEQLTTGLCCWRQHDGQHRLLCHDASARLAVVGWPFVDAIARLPA